MERNRSAPDEAGINDMIGFALGLLRRQYVVIAAATALAVAAAFAYVRYTPPTYTAPTQILLNNPKAQSVQQESPLAEPALDLTEIETQIQLLKSSATAIAVIKQLNLEADPDLNSPGPFAWLQRIVRGRNAPPPGEGHADDEPTEGLIYAFLDRLQAHRVGYSNIIEISYSSSSAARAAKIVNTVANAYIKEQLNAKLAAGRSATDWLQDRLREIGDQARTEERAVDTYKIEHNMVSSGGKPIDEQQVADFNTRIVAARAQTSDALARLNRYEALLRADSAAAPSAEMMGGAVTDALSSPIINSLRTEFLELQRRDSEWTAKYGETHLAVKELRIRMRELGNSIRNEVRRLADASRNDYELAQKRQQEMEKLLSDVVTTSRSTNSAEIALREMESRAKGYRNLYDTYQQRFVGAVQQGSFPISQARVIYPALPPDSKSKPKSALILALGAFGGLAFGVAMGLMRELADRVFRTPAQVEKELSLPCFSVVPRMPATGKPRTPRRDDRQADADCHQRLVSTLHSVDSTVVGMPFSRFAETIRSAKIGIDLNPTRTSNKVIGVTSSLPDEGKTTIAASLARLIAHSGRSVIIIDCDLRHPSLSNQLAPNAPFGLVEVIRGARPLEDAIWRDPKTNFAFLPAVRRRPLFHTSEMLASEATRRLFDQLRDAFDYVIVDLPPLAPVADARATASFVDCHLLVIEWGRTKIDVVKHALHHAPNVYENMVGAVLNKTDINRMRHYDMRFDDYYDERHYARYAVADEA